MLQLFSSNRYETLSAALLDDLAAAPPDPWAAQPVIVPSTALRRRLELDVAARHGVCANVAFRYLAQWLWEQIGAVISVPPASPFAPDRLVWRCYRLLGERDAPWRDSARLRTWLDAADAPMRYELARRLATVFDHYLTYRPEWLLHWQAGGSILAGAEAGAGSDGAAGTGPRLVAPTAAVAEDERWQAALWRALLGEVAAAGLEAPRETGGRPAKADATPPAYRFLEVVRTLDLDTVARARWPASVSVFALPTMPPLHVALLRELSRWIDVRLYVLNPCREYWFDIVSAGRLEQLDAAGQLDYQQVGHPLLAEWGRQTQAQLHLLHELTESAASSDASRFTPNPASSWLARVQNAMLDLRGEREAGGEIDEADQADQGDEADEAHEAGEPGGLAAPRERGIEVHVCHSLARQLEVLHDRLLRWFDEDGGLQPSDVLVAVPDLASAGPLIDAVFGTAPSGDARRIPYRITGLPPSQANPVARVLLDWLALPDYSVSAPELVEWLRVDAIAARYGIDAAALEVAQRWLAAAGARRGFAPAAIGAAEEGAPIAPARHTFADALTRLFLGYALPAGAEPVDAWLPIEGASGSDVELLGRLARFVDDIETFARECAEPRTPAQWSRELLDLLARVFDPGMAYADALAAVRETLDAMFDAMQTGAADEALPAAVIRSALAEALDDPARGGVPWGGVTFSSLTSLRGLPYRAVCLLGMDDGVLPSLARADEFDLMAVFGKPGDRQRRDDERNLFLDLLLAARERFFIAYTGRSIRDNAPLPPAALVDELLDHLAEVAAGPAATPQALAAARRAFVTEHALQPFAREYFLANGACGELFSYDGERAVLAGELAQPRRAATAAFFTAPLPAGLDEPVAFDDFVRFWRHPVRALLRERLGIVLADAEAELLDSEPFELDYAGSDALAERLLPALIEAGPLADEAALARFERIAAASPELPGGATGAVWQARELDALKRLAARVHDALTDGTTRLPFSLKVDARWPETGEAALFGAHDALLRERLAAQPVVDLHGTLNLLTPRGQVIFRHSRPGARDYLSAWLAHLVYCAVEPDGPRRTVWHGNGADFEFVPVVRPLDALAPLAALFRAGLAWPLRFFPKSAWARVRSGDGAAQNVWISERVRGESDDAALRIALRGTPLTLDEPFGTLAALVFEPLVQHLREAA